MKPDPNNRVCFGIMAMLGVHLATLQSILERMSADLGLSLTASGALVSMNFIGIIAGPLLAGETGDRFGRKPIILLAASIYIVAIVTAALSRAYSLLAASILACGFAYSVLESGVTGLISDRNPGRDAALIQYSQAYLSAGAVAGPALALAVLATPLSWRGMLGLMGVLFAALLLRVRHIPSEAPRTAVRRLPGAASLALLRERVYRTLCLSLLMYVGVEAAASYWMDTYFLRVLVEPSLGKIALMLFWGGTLTGRLAGGRWPQHSGRLLAGGLALSALSLAALPLIPVGWIGVALCALAGLGFSTVWPALAARASARYPDDRGAALGIMMAFSGLGGMAAPFALGLLADARGLGVAVWTLPAMTAVLLTLIAVLNRQERAASGDAQRSA